MYKLAICQHCKFEHMKHADVIWWIDPLDLSWPREINMQSSPRGFNLTVRTKCLGIKNYCCILLVANFQEWFIMNFMGCWVVASQFQDGPKWPLAYFHLPKTCLVVDWFPEFAFDVNMFVHDALRGTRKKCLVKMAELINDYLFWFIDLYVGLCIFMY